MLCKELYCALGQRGADRTSDYCFRPTTSACFLLRDLYAAPGVAHRTVPGPALDGGHQAVQAGCRVMKHKGRTQLHLPTTLKVAKKAQIQNK